MSVRLRCTYVVCYRLLILLHFFGSFYYIPYLCSVNKDHMIIHLKTLIVMKTSGSTFTSVALRSQRLLSLRDSLVLRLDSCVSRLSELQYLVSNGEIRPRACIREAARIISDMDVYLLRLDRIETALSGYSIASNYYISFNGNRVSAYDYFFK